MNDNEFVVLIILIICIGRVITVYINNKGE